MGQVNQKLGRVKAASIEYLEALRLADSMVVPPEQSEEISQMYEPLIEAQASQSDQTAHKRLCDNINDMLMRKDWRDHLYKAREQMPKSQDEDMPMPIAEVILQAQSSQVLEAITHIHQLARAGMLRSAMEEAFLAVTYAPTYLPLHTLIGDLLVRENHTEEAIAKYTTVAEAYSVRGEAAQSAKMLRRVVQLAPMDMTVRTKLIDQLVARGQVDDAIREYLELADIYYRLAELDNARKTYTKALRFVQQTNADRSWNIHILQRMADIDMQKLDWKQAVRVFEQIRTLRPDDEGVRRNLIELNLRLGQPAQAYAELENYLAYLQSGSRATGHQVHRRAAAGPAGRPGPQACPGPAVPAGRADRGCRGPARFHRRFVPHRRAQGGGDRDHQPDPADEPAHGRPIPAVIGAAAAVNNDPSPRCGGFCSYIVAPPDFGGVASVLRK